MDHAQAVNAMTIAAILVGAGSEIIALSPLKANSWVQLILQCLRLIFPKA